VGQVPLAADHEAISWLLYAEFSGSPVWGAVHFFERGQLASGAGLLHFFPVDNTAAATDAVVGELRAVVLACGEADEYARRTVPLAWVDALDGLRAERRGSLRREEVVAMARRCGLPTEPGLSAEAEAEKMLRLFSEMGHLMHFPEPALRHLVVLDPATFLVDAAARVICQHGYHKVRSAAGDSMIDALDLQNPSDLFTTRPS
jgi:hypothetical protein